MIFKKNRKTNDVAGVPDKKAEPAPEAPKEVEVSAPAVKPAPKAAASKAPAPKAPAPKVSAPAPEAVAPEVPAPTADAPASTLDFQPGQSKQKITNINMMPHADVFDNGDHYHDFGVAPKGQQRKPGQQQQMPPQMPPHMHHHHHHHHPHMHHMHHHHHMMAQGRGFGGQQPPFGGPQGFPPHHMHHHHHNMQSGGGGYGRGHGQGAQDQDEQLAHEMEVMHMMQPQPEAGEQRKGQQQPDLSEAAANPYGAPQPGSSGRAGGKKGGKGKKKNDEPNFDDWVGDDAAEDMLAMYECDPSAYADQPAAASSAAKAQSQPSQSAGMTAEEERWMLEQMEGDEFC